MRPVALSQLLYNLKRPLNNCLVPRRPRPWSCTVRLVLWDWRARFAWRSGPDADGEADAWQILFSFLAKMFGFSSKGVLALLTSLTVKKSTLGATWKLVLSTWGFWRPFGSFSLLYRADSFQRSLRLVSAKRGSPCFNLMLAGNLAQNQRFIRRNGMKSEQKIEQRKSHFDCEKIVNGGG